MGTTVPKTLIFAKNDHHAEDILEVVREEFGFGNEEAVGTWIDQNGRRR